MEPAQYRDTVYQNVENQLQLMNTVLEASQKTLQATPIKTDKLVDDNVYVSSLNTKALKEILKSVSRITKMPNSNHWNIWLYSMLGLTLFGSLAILRKIVKS